MHADNVLSKSYELNKQSSVIIENLQGMVVLLEDQKDFLNHLPTIAPTRGWLSSGYGKRISPFTGSIQFHEGLDLSNHPGTAVIAPAAGKVIKIGRDSGLGKHITIDHGYNITTKYAHLRKYHVKIGDLVNRYQLIAEMGNTGRSTGPHLHYETIIDNKPINPIKFIFDDIKR
ncbi:MAG: M23 family metallopeptidase [Pseudomonadota bacterium]